MTRYLDECGKKWKTEKQIKPGWKKKMRRPTTDEEIVIARIVAEKEEKLDKEKDLIVLRTTEEMVPRWFHKYIKVFEKKESERMLIRKT